MTTEKAERPKSEVVIEAASYRFLSIERCPAHSFWAVCISDSLEEWSSGNRLTPSKCCGSWKTVTQWKLSPDDLRDMSDELLRRGVGVTREDVAKLRRFAETGEGMTGADFDDMADRLEAVLPTQGAS